MVELGSKMVELGSQMVQQRSGDWRCLGVTVRELGGFHKGGVL